jgi:putative ABC transport system ATP-binding protein
MSDAVRVTTTDLRVDYRTPTGTVRALDCQPLEIASGTSVAVMGESGSGKSTLVGLLAGLAVPTRGSVTVGLEIISSMSEPERVAFRRRSIGMVYQADNLLPHLTVEENVALQLSICRRGAPVEEQVDPRTVLARLGIAHLAERLPDQLSGGERQRAAVARAVVHRPSLLLADEPTGALDASSARDVIELLVDVHQLIGATLVVVTHDAAIAAYANRTIVLESPAFAVAGTDAR